MICSNVYEKIDELMYAGWTCLCDFDNDTLSRKNFQERCASCVSKTNKLIQDMSNTQTSNKQ